MNSLLSTLIGHISYCIYHIASQVHKLLLLIGQQKPPGLPAGPGGQERAAVLYHSNEENLLLEAEQWHQNQAEMKKVRFSDEEDNMDGEMAAFTGYNMHNDNHQPEDVNGAEPIENGELSIGELKARLQEQQYHIEALNETLKRLQEEGGAQAQQLRGLNHQPSLEQAQAKIDELEKENQLKETTIDDLRRGLSNALEVASNNGLTNGYSEKEEEYLQKIAGFEADLMKLEQKLSNATEEKEYYKKHYNTSHDNHSTSNNFSNALNGSISDRDDFGKELMLANKRKYHLESKVRQLEHDLKEAQNTVQHLDRSLKSSEKYLWLEKEKSAMLEQERKSLNDELDWLRRDNDYLKRQIEVLNQEKNSGLESPGEEARSPTYPSSPNQGEVGKQNKEYETKLGEVLQMKNQLEWRLGEITKNWNDAKWRVGELEAALAHKDYELDQSANRIKQLESVLATPVTNMSEEINWLKEEVHKVGEEKAKADWRLGEVTQYWNDAKWRIGELEGEVSHLKHSLEEAHRRAAELENHSELKREIDNVRQEKGHLEWRLTQLDKAYNDAKWRVGELEAEVGRKAEHIHYLESVGHPQTNFEEERNSLHRQLSELRDQKSKVEWRLGEVTQYWSDTKRRVDELEESVKQKESQLKDASFKIEQLAENRKESIPNISERVLTQLSNGSFIVTKQPYGDRHRWNMVTWDNLVSQNSDLRRVWFEVSAEGAKEVFLIGSFMNWECALLCAPLPEDPSRRGVWIDLPLGRHHFRFIRDGSWFTAGEYAQENNEYGGTNNCISVG